MSQAERNGVRNVENGFRAAHRAMQQCINLCRMVRLRQVPPVIADRVTDLKRFVSRETDEEKWYHGFTARLLMLGKA